MENKETKYILPNYFVQDCRSNQDFFVHYAPQVRTSTMQSAALNST